MIKRSKTAIRALLPKNTFARGVGVLVGGTASAQILLVLAVPILTRLYTPEDFGLLAVYASLLAIIGVISTLRYELAIPLPEDDVEAANVAVLSLLLVAISTALTAILLLMLGTSIFELLGVPVLANYMWLIPVGLLISGAYSVFNYWSVRIKRFGTIAQTKIIQAIASLIIQLVTFKFGFFGLLLGQVAGQSVGTTNLARPALAMLAFKQVSWCNIKKVAIKYKRFPLYSNWAALFNVVGHQMPSLLIASFFMASAVGFYTLAVRVLLYPASVISNSVGSVFFSEAANSYRKGTLKILYIKIQSRLIEYGFPPLILLTLFAPDVFFIVFGSDWEVAGHLSQWLILTVFASFVISPTSTIFSIINKQNIGMWLQINLFLLRFSALIFGGFYLDINGTVAIYSILSVLGYTLFAIMIMINIGVPARAFYRPVMNGILYSVLAALPLYLLKVTEVGIINGYGLLAFLAFITIVGFRYYFISLNEYRAYDVDKKIKN